MLFKCARCSVLLYFLLLFFGIASIGICRTDGSKSAVKTVKTKYGDIYDCVDFYKQPALNHPLLKNHSYHPQMKPTFQPQRIRSNNVSWKMNVSAADIFPFKDGRCPKGTVPIRRINKNKVPPEEYSKPKIPNTSIDYISGTIMAISQTKSNPWKAYNGVGAVIAVYKPRVLESQYSSAEIIIKGGTDTIIAGWTVNPGKYSDNHTRFFVYAVAGDVHCFNTECGFVNVYGIPTDFVILPISERGGKIYAFKFCIHRDPKNGVWWLQVGMNNPQITIGFWPQKIFTGLQQPATYAACGGEAYTIPTIPPPEIGTGYYPGISGFQYDAYCTEFVVMDEKNTIVDAADTELYATHEFVYGVDYRQMKSGGQESQHVVFGGPSPS